MILRLGFAGSHQISNWVDCRIFFFVEFGDAGFGRKKMRKKGLGCWPVVGGHLRCGGRGWWERGEK